MAFRIAQTLTRRQNWGSPLFKRSARSVNTVQHLANTLPNLVLTPLPTGLRVVSGSSTENVVTVSVVIQAGSSNETPETNGVAGLLQRTLIEGKTGAVRKFGGQLSGQSTRDKTTFSVTCLNDNVADAVSILGDLVQSSLCDKALEKARTQLLSNRKELWNTVNEEVMFDYLYSAAYQGTSFAQTPEGEISVIKKLDKNSLENFRTSKYTGYNIVLSTVGNVKHSTVVSAAEKAFSTLPSGTAPGLKANARIPFTGSQMSIRDDTVHNTQVLIAHETFSIAGAHVATLAVIKELVGSWSANSNVGAYSSGRLAEIVALQKLGDTFQTFSHHYKNTGVFGVYATTQHDEVLDDLVYHIFNEYQKLNAYVTADEVFRAKNAVKAKILASRETSLQASRHLAQDVLNTNRIISVPEYFFRIDEVTEEDIHDVLGTYFHDVDPVVISHGKMEEMPEYSILRSWTKWNRW